MKNSKGMRGGILLSVFISLSSILAVQGIPPAQIDPFQLAVVLKASREYCQRLERAALDLVCVEEVSETIDLTKDARKGVTELMPTPAMIGDEVNTRYSSPGLRFKASSPNNQANTYLFDYQFVRKAGKVGEKRALIEKNGKKADPKEPPPNTQAFQYSDILLAPVQLLDERFQEYYTYRLLREDVLNGEKAWVLEVAPRITSGTRYLGGTLWLKQTNSSVLRIKWDPATFGHYEKILLRAKTYRAKPQVVSYTEFGFEKNGLRFPSVDFTEEAYLADNNKVFIRAQTRVAYKNYKFFTVETETAIRK